MFGQIHGERLAQGEGVDEVQRDLVGDVVDLQHSGVGTRRKKTNGSEVLHDKVLGHVEAKGLVRLLVATVQQDRLLGSETEGLQALGDELSFGKFA